MKIFLSYASEDSGIAGEINGALTNEDHKVFFSGYDVHPGEGFDRKIRENIEQCDIFIFLISPDSVRKGKYTLSELGLAEAKWEKPEGYIIPVMLRETPRPTIPASLTRLDFLTERGNLVADIAGAVAKIDKERFSRWISPATRQALIATACGLIIGGSAVALFPRFACTLGLPGCQPRGNSAIQVSVRCDRQRDSQDRSTGNLEARAYVLVKGVGPDDPRLTRLKQLPDVGKVETVRIGDPQFSEIVKRIDDRAYVLLSQPVDRNEIKFLMPKLNLNETAHFFIGFANAVVTGEVDENATLVATGGMGDTPNSAGLIRELANFDLLEEEELDEFGNKITRAKLTLKQGTIDCW